MIVKKLSEIVDLQKGKKPKISSKSVENLPYLTAKYIRGEAEPEYGIPDSEGSVVVNHDDYVIIMDGSNSGEVFTGLNGILASTMGKLVLKEKINMKYLGYFLDSNKELFSKTKTGSAIPHLSKEIFFGLQIPVPTLQEQEKIVEKLDKLFENIDKAFVVKESEILSLTNLFDSFLDNTIEEFGESEQKLGEYYDVRDGTHDSPKYYEKGYPLITSKNLKDGKLNFEKIKFISEEDFNKINERSKVNMGDVLMAMIGTIGNPVVIKDNSKFAIKNVALFKLNNNQSSEYLYYFLRSNKVKKKMIAEAKGTTQKFVGLGYLRNFTITGKFDLNAENEVVFLISKIENIINKFINNQQQIYTKLLELKKSILNKEFSYE